MTKEMILDIEIYPNYVLYAFKKGKKVTTFDVFGANKTFSNDDKIKIKKLLTKNLIVTFNGNGFDIPIIQYSLISKDATVAKLKIMCDDIILRNFKPFALYRSAGIMKSDLIPINHIDIMNVAKGTASLKLYGTRIHSKKLWELPFDPSKPLTKKESKILKSYCENDLDVTAKLYETIHTDIELRTKMSKEYDLDLRSLNGANIAQNVILKEIGYTGKRPDAPEFIKYKAPAYVKFKTKEFKDLKKYLESHIFLLSEAKKVVLPAKLKNLEFSHKYHIQLGIGGLHLSPKSKSFYATKKKALLDIDVTSFYPTMIIENKFIIKHLGDSFLKVYKGFYDTRTKVLKPKLKTLEKGSSEYNDALSMSNGYKLILNSFFGKTSERFSKLYDPSVMLHTTLTGQLILLMYIEKMELMGYEVVYGNTDGITIILPRNKIKTCKEAIFKLDKKCKVTMEFEQFKSMHLRDVNNFVNITESGYSKAKGAYGKPVVGFDGTIDTNALDKNIDAPIVYEAVRQYLTKGTPLKYTIDSCEDFRQFLVGRQVRGGGVWSGDIPDLYPEDWEEKLNSKRGLTKKIICERAKLEALWVKDNGIYLGKVVRYYYSKKGHSIHYKSNGNKVPKSDGAKPLMDLVKKFPKDIDYARYYDYAKTALEDLGVCDG